MTWSERSRSIRTGRNRIRRRSAGYTLGEITSTLGLVGVLAACTVPPFASMYMSTRVKTAASELAAALRLARQTAAERRIPVHVVAAGKGGWADGWQVRVRDEVIHVQDGPLPISISEESGGRVVYDSTGRPTRALGHGFRLQAPGYGWVAPRCVMVRPDGRPVVLAGRGSGDPCR